MNKNKKILISAISALVLMIAASLIIYYINREPPYYLEQFDLTESERQIIESIFKLEEKHISEDNIKSIKRLTIAGREVEKDKGVDGYNSESYRFKNKTRKYEESFTTEELSFLRVFKHINYLEIFYAPNVSDISFLSDFANLTELKVTATNIKDFSFIKELVNLNSVCIITSPIESIELPSNNKITSFSISRGKLTSLSFLETLNENCAFLCISDNLTELTDLSYINRFKKLETLTVSAKNLNLSFLSEAEAKIHTLNIGGDGLDLSDIKLLAESLEVVTISNSNGVDLRPLDEIKDLSKILLYNVKDPIRGELTKEGSEVLKLDTPFNPDILSWFEYAD